MHGCSEVEHSWAWISPSGEFFDVPDHGTWAEWHPQFREEIIERWAHEKSGYGDPSDLLTPVGWEYMGTMRKKIRVTPEYFRLMVDRIAGATTWEQLDAMEAPEIGRQPVFRLTHRIRPGVLATVQRRIRHLPNLSTGEWTPETHLTRAENDFIFWADDEFGEGTWFETSKERVLDRNEKWRAEAWRMMKWHLIHNGRGVGNAYLLELGWMQVTNPFNVKVHKDNPVQWDTLFTEAVACVNKDPMPEEFHIDFGEHRYKKTTFGEALTEYASRRVSDRLFGEVMEKFHSNLRTRAIRMAYSNPNLRPYLLAALS